MFENQEIYQSFVPVALAASAAARFIISHVAKRAAQGAFTTAKRLTSKKAQTIMKLSLMQQLGLTPGGSPTATRQNLSSLINLADSLYQKLGKAGLLNTGQSTASNKFNRHQRNPRKGSNSSNKGTTPTRPNRRTG